ncbi:hypothetical protein MTO96_006859 [Rhipicephalus appendiculatus]
MVLVRQKGSRRRHLSVYAWCHGEKESTTGTARPEHAPCSPDSAHHVHTETAAMNAKRETEPKLRARWTGGRENRAGDFRIRSEDMSLFPEVIAEIITAAYSYGRRVPTWLPAWLATRMLYKALISCPFLVAAA